MKHSLQIAATVDKPDQLENMVEKLAFKRFDNGYSQQIVPQNWKALETSSTEVYVSGSVRFDDEKDHLSIPFITRFLFTCIKAKGENYKMAWSVSLS